jgi:hypothetical protein
VDDGKQQLLQILALVVGTWSSVSMSRLTFYSTNFTLSRVMYCNHIQSSDLITGSMLQGIMFACYIIRSTCHKLIRTSSIAF